MASKGTSGWESLGGNDPTKYQATFDYDNGTIGSNGKQNKSKIVVITDRSNGSYDVYKKTLFGDKLIYQSNASTTQPTIKNQADYNNFFTGKNTQQYKNLTGGVKQATLNLAKETFLVVPQEKNIRNYNNNLVISHFQILKNHRSLLNLK